MEPKSFYEYVESVWDFLVFVVTYIDEIDFRF